MINQEIKSAIILLVFCIMQLSLRSQNTIVTGYIKGFTSRQLEIGYHAGEKSKTDTVRVVKGKFTWKANLAEPQQVYLVFPNMYYPFFAQSGHIQITGIADSSESFVVTGSKVQDEYIEFQKSLKDLTDQEALLPQDNREMREEEKKALDVKLNEIEEARRKREDQYIAVHPTSFLSVHLITERASYGTDYADVKKLYDRLGVTAKQTMSGKALAKRLDVLKRSAIGNQMIDFRQKDTTGSDVHFANFKGKYVLVDFWASWCGPCRAENPNVLKAYNKYKDKNFTVVGISLDDKGDNWKKAIRDDNMPWAQLSDLRGFNNEVSSYYGIEGIPSNLLVDPTGKIIARDLRGEKLQQKLGELLN